MEGLVEWLCLPSEHEALSSNSGTEKKKRKKEK
jgi:hypothetical protein